MTSYRLNTTLRPVAAGVLAALAAREDLKNQAANQVLERLLREELERLAPGLWDILVYSDAETPMVRREGDHGVEVVPKVSPRERAAAVAELVADHLRRRDG